MIRDETSMPVTGNADGYGPRRPPATAVQKAEIYRALPRPKKPPRKACIIYQWIEDTSEMQEWLQERRANGR